MGRCDYEGAQARVAEPVLMLTLNTPVSYFRGFGILPTGWGVRWM